ncbi:MAG TPA: ammonia channel protein, partial [Brevundimonas sp.]
MSQVLNRLPGILALLILTAVLFYAGGAFAQDAAPAAAPALLGHQVPLELNGADTSWLATSTALV